VSETVVVEIARQTIEVTLLVSMPLLVVSLVVGLVVSLFQVATSLQDVTLTFVPKIIAVGLTLLFAAHWMLEMLVSFTRDLLGDFSRFVG
jgi:flagellar biosynthetic protein FliQ